MGDQFLSLRGRMIAVAVAVAAVTIVLVVVIIAPMRHRASDGHDGVVSRGETGTLDEHDAIFSQFVGDKRTSVEAKEQDWLTRALGAGAVQAADQTRFAEALRSVLDDPDALLSSREVESLVTTIARHAAARSNASPGMYLALCEDESSLYEWTPWPANQSMHAFLDYWRIPHDDTTTPQTALSLVWERFMDEAGDRFEALGTNSDGARIVVRLVRTEDQADDQFFRTPQEMEHWSGELMTTRSQEFRRPMRSLGDVLKGRSGAVVAQCMVLVRMANGYPINWVSSWFLDPETGQWVCGAMVYKRARLTAMIF